MESKDLRNVGLKVTLPRLRILEVLETNKEKHMTADDIYRYLVESGQDIGLATVYRVLNQFEIAGLIEKHNFEGGEAHFEIDAGAHHDHMVCVETGRVVEFVSEEIEELQKKIAEAHGYEIEDHSLVIYVKPKRKS